MGGAQCCNRRRAELEAETPFWEVAKKPDKLPLAADDDDTTDKDDDDDNDAAATTPPPDSAPPAPAGGDSWLDARTLAEHALQQAESMFAAFGAGVAKWREEGSDASSEAMAELSKYLMKAKFLYMMGLTHLETTKTKLAAEMEELKNQVEKSDSEVPEALAAVDRSVDEKIKEVHAQLGRIDASLRAAKAGPQN